MCCSVCWRAWKIPLSAGIVVGRALCTSMYVGGRGRRMLYAGAAGASVPCASVAVGVHCVLLYMLEAVGGRTPCAGVAEETEYKYMILDLRLCEDLAKVRQKLDT